MSRVRWEGKVKAVKRRETKRREEGRANGDRSVAKMRQRSEHSDGKGDRTHSSHRTDRSSGGGGARVFSSLNDQEKKGGKRERERRGGGSDPVTDSETTICGAVRCGAVATLATRALHS